MVHFPESDWQAARPVQRNNLAFSAVSADKDAMILVIRLSVELWR
jgi:hypothetical protein